MTREEIERELKDLHFFLVREYDYAEWFRAQQYSNRILSQEERNEFIQIVNEIISSEQECQHIMIEGLEVEEGKDNDLSRILRALYSTRLFISITMADCMVASKYFLLANNEYDKQYLRGKMRVLYNEGFKRLYGYEKKTKNKSEWSRLAPIMKHFPEMIRNQYQEMTNLLENHSNRSTWWKDERNCETHLETERLYALRQEDIQENKEMMDSLILYNALLASEHFVTNAIYCVFNYMVKKVKRGEVTIVEES